jgi:hypothetical protein
MKEYHFIQVDILTDKPFGGNTVRIPVTYLNKNRIL